MALVLRTVREALPFANRADCKIQSPQHGLKALVTTELTGPRKNGHARTPGAVNQGTDATSGDNGSLAEATAIARIQIDTSREQTNRIKAEIAELDKLALGLTRLMMDPNIKAAAKPVVVRQMEEIGPKREKLQAALDQVAEGSRQSAELLVESSLEAFRDAKLGFAESASDQQFKRVGLRFATYGILPRRWFTAGCSEK